MTVSAQWLKVKEIVGEALEREPAERQAFLNRACSEDSSLRSEVDSLLAASSEGEALSKMNWAKVIASGWEAPGVIGPYRLERELGSGGMGQVWLAEQREPVQRWIALKLIRGGFYDSAVVERFLGERQSLAMMNHPAIAKVFDAGTTEAGQPYLAMEYVDGLSITAYCDEKKLVVAERLRLFMQVCEGVQHAHQKAIIHRDLKPSNILVAEVDGKPAPRIIDFGLAKSAAAGGADLTQMGCFLGTPGYMSPEQADAGSVETGSIDVDTRTDVYSLGVLLYELLTGYLPFEMQRGREQRFDEAPVRPSAKAGTSKTAAEIRGLDARQLARVLRGDLDWITLKALERDRDRRYGSPADLAADVGRYLENRPVQARPASRGYQLQKYLRRHRMRVVLGSAALGLLIAFAAAQSIQLSRIKRERDRADRITKFMTAMFKVADPTEAHGNSITAREILDKGAAEISSGSIGDPVLQADLMQVMGEVYESIGLASTAGPLFGQAANIRERALGSDDPKTLTSRDSFAWILYETGHTDQAVMREKEIVKRRRRVQGSDDPDMRNAMQRLGVYLSEAGRVPEAETIHREILAASLRTAGPDARETFVGMNNLAADLIREQHFEEARTLLTQAVAKERSFLSPDNPMTLLSMNNLGDVLLHMSQYTEAEKDFQEVRDVQRATLGPDHPNTAGSTYNLAIVAEFQGNRDKALTLLTEALSHGLAQRDALHIKNDPDLKSMHNDKRFQVLISEIEHRNPGVMTN